MCGRSRLQCLTLLSRPPIPARRWFTPRCIGRIQSVRGRKTRGFTLLELLASLALIGLATLGGVLLLRQIGDSAKRISRDSADAARAGNGARMLRQLLLDARASTDTTRHFRGDTRSIDFWSLCDAAGAWVASATAWCLGGPLFQSLRGGFDVEVGVEGERRLAHGAWCARRHRHGHLSHWSRPRLGAAGSR